MADESATLTAAQLLELAAVPSERIELPGLGAVYVRGLTAGEAGKVGQMHNAGRADRLAASMVCWCLQDADGRPLFQPDQVGQVMAWRNDLVQPIVDAVMRLSGMEGGADAALAAAQGN